MEKKIISFLILAYLLCLIFSTDLLDPERKLFGMLEDYGILFCFLVSLFYFVTNKMNVRYFKINFIFLLICYMFLSTESILRYGKIMLYPHIILFLSYILYTFAFYGLFSDQRDVMRFIRRLCYSACGIVYIIILSKTTYLSNIFEVKRATAAHYVYLLLLANLLLIISYFQNGRKINIAFIITNFFIILIEQHRTVWICSIWSLSIFSILLLRCKNVDLKNKHIRLSFFAILIILVILSHAVIFGGEKYDKIMEFLNMRFKEISEFKEKGTGAWRYEQYKYYMPFIAKNSLFGMRFKGFELPPLYDFIPGKLTGHHFHSGYLTALLYNGIFGLWLIFGSFVYYVVRFLKLQQYSLENIALFSFLSSAFLWSLSYELPEFVFAILGLAFVCLQNNETKSTLL
ncbi:MAG: O-antigen ligase family protein [Candidatus Omnitrophota bacterium]